MGFLKFLFYAIIILTIVRFVMARIFPWLLRKFARKMQEKAFEQFQQRHSTGDSHGRPRKPDGQIHIDYIPPQPKNSEGTKKAGEFVDFEEIK